MQRKEDFDPGRFKFRGLHPGIYLGAASDRYSGWMGQIYTEGRYEGKVSKRSHRVGKKTFKQEVLPLESLEEYFEHFRALEVDYTFYSPLLNEGGEPTRSYHTLKEYGERLSEGDFLLLKVPQAVFAQKILYGSTYRQNPDYLSPEIFRRSFYEPALSLLGSNLRGFIFEQEYQRLGERVPAKRFAEELDAFFESVPEDNRYHVELRTDSYLVKPVFDVLEKHGVGQVLSHWTWLPPLRKQFEKAESRFFNSGDQCVVRLMTPRGVRYEDAYAMAHPFDRLVDGMLQPEMIEETLELMHIAVSRGKSMNVIINNRSGGNTPLIARKIAEGFASPESLTP